VQKEKCEMKFNFNGNFVHLWTTYSSSICFFIISN